MAHTAFRLKGSVCLVYFRREVGLVDLDGFSVLRELSVRWSRTGQPEQSDRCES
ncbi:MAG TPA: hypothetical protein VKX41_16840 [Alloacidobacterium sp.]|nr:hypothetical protein [Alloacidobacterium sp.]